METKGKILRDLHSMVANEEISDFKFVVDGKEFFVHKALLAGEKKKSKKKRTPCSHNLIYKDSNLQIFVYYSI